MLLAWPNLWTDSERHFSANMGYSARTHVRLFNARSNKICRYSDPAHVRSETTDAVEAQRLVGMCESARNANKEHKEWKGWIIQRNKQVAPCIRL